MALNALSVITIGVVICLLGVTYKVRSLREECLLLSADTETRSLNLDAYIDLQLPKSFELRRRTFQPRTLENFYGLEPEELDAESFTYSFVRGSYVNLGGVTVESVLLSLVVHSKMARPDGSSEMRSPSTFPKRVAKYNDPAGRFDLFIDIDPSKAKIDERSAEKLLSRIAPSIQIRSPWKDRLNKIKADFYRRYPEKQPSGGTGIKM